MLLALLAQLELLEIARVSHRIVLGARARHSAHSKVRAEEAGGLDLPSFGLSVVWAKVTEDEET